MHNPPHPGDFVKMDLMPHYNLTVTALAELILVSRNTMSKIINGKAAITVDLAMRLASAFGTTAEFWLNLQQQYDIYHMSKK